MTRKPPYSNYGTNLAGYIVERLSGVAWDTYVEQNILKPLGMAWATAYQPLPEALQSDMATGYLYAGGNPGDAYFEHESKVYQAYWAGRIDQLGIGTADAPGIPTT